MMNFIIGTTPYDIYYYMIDFYDEFYNRFNR